MFGTPLPALTSTRRLLDQALSHVHFRARQLCRPQEFRNLTLGEPSCQRYTSEITPGYYINSRRTSRHQPHPGRSSPALIGRSHMRGPLSPSPGFWL